MASIPVSKQSGLRAYWNQIWGNGLTRTYSPGNLLTTAAASNGNEASPGAVFNPPGINQTGDPRANSVGSYSSSLSPGALSLLQGLGNNNVGGSVTNNYASPVARAFSSGMLLPLLFVGFILYLLLRSK